MERPTPQRDAKCVFATPGALAVTQDGLAPHTEEFHQGRLAAGMGLLPSAKLGGVAQDAK